MNILMTRLIIQKIIRMSIRIEKQKSQTYLHLAAQISKLFHSTIV